MSVGFELRRARERRGITLDQISQETKINVSVLRHLEADDIDQLPGGVFVRGFLRAYARQVGLDPEETVAAYLEQFAPPAPVEHAPDAAEIDASGDRRADRPGYRPTRTQWIAAAAVVAAVIVGYALVHYRTAAPPPAGAATEVAAVPAAAPSATGTAGSQRAAATDRDLLHLQVRAQGPCWVTATVDGTRAVYKLLQPGEQQTLDVHERATLRVGDPASFAFSIDGVPGRSLGPAGVPATITITPQNYREFLAR